MLRRLALTVPTMLAAATLVFLLDPRRPGRSGRRHARRERAGGRIARRSAARSALDRPLTTQYAAFLRGRGDGRPRALARARHAGRDAPRRAASRRPPSSPSRRSRSALGLALPLGLAAAARPGTWLDRGSVGFALLGVSVPSFWLGPMLIILFAIDLRWLPVSGTRHVGPPGPAGVHARSRHGGDPDPDDARERPRSASARTTCGPPAPRGQPRRILTHHALRNALGPVVTILGLQFGALLAGTVITETIFAWPGLGRLLIDAINQRDYPVVQGCILAIAAGFVLANALADVVNALARSAGRRGRGAAMRRHESA